MIKKKRKEKILRCWEFFHCSLEEQQSCLISEFDEWQCWLINAPCCKMNKDTPRPLSVKRIICKTCEYYKEYQKPQ